MIYRVIQSVSQETSTAETEHSEPDSLVRYVPTWLLSPSPEKDEPLIFDCIQCLHKRQLPARLLPQPPFNRKRYEVIYHPNTPRILQNLCVAIVRTTEAVSKEHDPRSDAVISRYHSQSLTELKTLIEGAVGESHGFTLSCIIFFMLADLIQLEHLPSGAWAYHLGAARKVILLRGGFLRCFRYMSDIRPLLCNSMLIDIHAATLSHSLLLKGSLESHIDYMGFLANGEEIHKQGFLFRPGLEDTVYTISLRISKRLRLATSRDFGTILQSLESFDALSWVRQVTSYGRSQPLKPSDCLSSETATGWSALPAAYKSAALLYLLLSCGHVSDFSDRVKDAKRTLAASIHYVIEIGSTDFDAPKEAQIWRLLDWPVLISTYVRIGWGIGEESTEVDIERLDQILKDTNRKGAASGFIKRVLVKRRQDPEKIWDWDDGFDSRAPFYLA